jgi:hypothetical protein
MRGLVAGIIGLGAAMAAGAASAGDPLRPWDDAGYWRNFDWARLETTEVWRKAGRAAKDDGQGPYAEISQPPAFKAGGMRYAVRFVGSSSRPTERLAILTGPFTDPAACSKTRQWLVAAYGEPETTVDLPRPNGSAGSTNEQWRVGTTTITSLCFGIDYGRPLRISLIQFESTATVRTLAPPIVVSCTRAGGNGADPILFKIDEFGEEVLDAGNIPLKNSKVEPLRASGMFGDPDGPMTVQIDRQGGTAVFRDAAGEVVVRAVCRKVDQAARAF